MKTFVVIAASILFACSNNSPADDGGTDATNPSDAADEAVSEGGSCGAPGTACDNPLNCCSHGCQGKSLDDGGQITICK